MIENLDGKLIGSIPITRLELFTLVDSWGRKDNFKTYDNIYVDYYEFKEQYDLSNLDVSKIEDLSEVFRESLYNGDLSKWDISNCKILDKIFCWSEFNNDSLKDWNTSKVESMEYVFYASKFNGEISNLDISNVLNMNFIFQHSTFDGDISFWNFNKNLECSYMFDNNKNFINKYNNGKELPSYASDFLIWFENNREKMREINTSKEEVLDFFSFDNNLNKDITND